MGQPIMGGKITLDQAKKAFGPFPQPVQVRGKCEDCRKCKKCKVPYSYEAKKQPCARNGWHQTGAPYFGRIADTWVSKGCAKCEGTGTQWYSGQITGVEKFLGLKKVYAVIADSDHEYI